ncbi:hypothetical protein AB1Y20_000271 [Prymnesium parvum]|uniref:6-phosphofructo-2-kinase domain-containing protein n=1 Tax=Prymnesium parvum TaxID=97485 RepID=A0AB34K7N1_PRYPA|eukprot:CAMPEP_0182815448 /NCGR_PEP_ID=MMETSP0006_2-20121128/10394_1 /TAXON_ID=97485 /ORGANISM="Prymnesium parvum, Strain Texoma1" /LENGTH=484 /DNA_ID=CAMNT_0024941643 /DNA_START=21 /DNA_END=1475 /DNA_ORIENTATION=-
MGSPSHQIPPSPPATPPHTPASASTIGMDPAAVSRRTFYSTHFSDVVQERIVIAMVGLPARGKSYMSKAIVRYCNFLGVSCRLFNAGNTRRSRGGAGADASFFDPENASSRALKEQIAMETLEQLLEWLCNSTGLSCGIFDATNTTRARREALLERCRRAPQPVSVIFLETVCNDEAILQQNYQLKMRNEDYEGKDEEQALLDFIQRVKAYEKVYEPITDEEAEATAYPPMRYIRVVDAGKKLVVFQLDGDSIVCKWIVQLMNAIHLAPRKLTIALAGESLNDVSGIRGGDSALSEEGYRYATAVTELVKQRIDTGRPPPLVLAGTLQRYEQMADMLRPIAANVLPFRPLNELCFGLLEGLRAGLLCHSFPAEHAAREADKLNYRYPGVGGQSYFDLIMQMQSILMTIEASRRDIIIICDAAVSRVLLGYFEATPIKNIPEVPVAPGIVEFTRSHSGFVRNDVGVETGRSSMLTMVGVGQASPA